jgi:hypothetical protein
MKNGKIGYNLFAFIKDDLITKVGIKEHLLPPGTLSQKELFLAAHAQNDLVKAIVYPLPSHYLTFDPLNIKKDIIGIPYLIYAYMKGKNQEIDIYEQALQGEKAPAQPLVYYHSVLGDRIIESHC